ncbi:MAG: phosphatase PAP2 family protein [Bacteroidota bacterium]
MVRAIVYLLLSGLLFPSLGWCQDGGPYQVNVPRIVGYTGTGLGLTVTSRIIKSRIETVPLSTIELGTVPSFDRWSVRVATARPANVSDATLLSSAALPGLLLLHRKSRNNAGKIGLLYFEAMLINYGLTDLVKTTALRPRPFLRATDLPGDTPVDHNGLASYFSGHTSGSATACFFFAQVFQDYYPDSPWRYGVWATAATLPAVTGYLRIRAGKHYLSDVVSGYLVGGAIGMLIPILHKKPITERRLNVSPSIGGVHLSWQF